MVRKYRMIHNQVIPKVHQHGVSSCALHQYDLNGSATNELYLRDSLVRAEEAMSLDHYQTDCNLSVREDPTRAPSTSNRP